MGKLREPLAIDVDGELGAEELRVGFGLREQSSHGKQVRLPLLRELVARHGLEREEPPAEEDREHARRSADDGDELFRASERAAVARRVRSTPR